jgi:hypothetical protein
VTTSLVTACLPALCVVEIGRERGNPASSKSPDTRFRGHDDVGVSVAPTGNAQQQDRYNLLFRWENNLKTSSSVRRAREDFRSQSMRWHCATGHKKFGSGSSCEPLPMLQNRGIQRARHQNEHAPGARRN